jgi:hypothetical protein
VDPLIPSYSLLNRLQIVAARNEQAHETAGEFAELLLHEDIRGGEIYNFWKDIFPLVYGATVEVIAAREKEERNNMLFGSV